MSVGVRVDGSRKVEDIASISVFYHTLCADKDGRAILGAPFLLGWETRNNLKTPQPIPIPQHIKIVQVAPRISLAARDAEGNVYSWGSTENGRQDGKFEEHEKDKVQAFKSQDQRQDFARRDWRVYLLCSR